jgi:8-oxo-dGTP pyrophosphatase MutT (NUDIX family)
MAEPIRAAGVIARSPEGRVLMMNRTDGEGWSWPGGVIKDGENADEAAMREFFEETNYRLGRIAPLMRRVRDGVDYSMYISEFVPTLNHEHSAYMWADPQAALEEARELDPQIVEVVADSVDRLEARLAKVEEGLSRS